MKLQLTVPLMLKTFPRANPSLLEQLVPFFNMYLPIFGIDSYLEVCHFMAQAAKETDEFRSLTEYASGRDYEGRLDLGNDVQGEGVWFKGHGIFMTTGDLNHTMTGREILNNEVFGEGRLIFANDEVRKRPTLLALPQWAVASACIYWIKRDLSALCKPDNEIVVIPVYDRKIKKFVKQSMFPIEAITRKINGGLNGFNERKRYYEICKIHFLTLFP